jgi:hypothetical protein
MPDYCHFDCIDLVYAAARPITLRFVKVVFPGGVIRRGDSGDEYLVRLSPPRVGKPHRLLVVSPGSGTWIQFAHASGYDDTTLSPPKRDAAKIVARLVLVEHSPSLPSRTDPP